MPVRTSPSSPPPPPRPPPDPLASRGFAFLRAVAWSLAQRGLTPASARTPADEARIATFFALGELLRLLEAFRGACVRGEPARLTVAIRRRSRRHVTVEIEIRTPGPLVVKRPGRRM